MESGTPVNLTFEEGMGFHVSLSYSIAVKIRGEGNLCARAL